MTIVHREIQRLNVLIGDLLDYANPRPKQPVDFDLGDAGRRDPAGRARRPGVRRRRARRRSSSSPLPMHADPAKLRQVAVEPRAQRGRAASWRQARARRRARRRDGATIAVADDGPGMAAERRSRGSSIRSSRRSRRAPASASRSCYAIVAEHGGRIDVETERRQGHEDGGHGSRAGVASTAVQCPICTQALEGGELVMVCTACHQTLGGGLVGRRDRRVPRADARASSRRSTSSRRGRPRATEPARGAASPRARSRSCSGAAAPRCATSACRSRATSWTPSSAATWR